MNQQQLKEVLSYDEATGVFTWLRTGKTAGSAFHNGYRSTYLRIKVGGKACFAHRLAWLYMTGEWPAGDIDHIDHDGLNNRFANLRIVSDEINQKNARMSAANKTGISGVCFVAKTNRWHAWVSRAKKQAHLGSFLDLFEACCARKSAELRHDYHSNYGLA